jgi:hypothetical protein
MGDCAHILLTVSKREAILVYSEQNRGFVCACYLRGVYVDEETVLITYRKRRCKEFCRKHLRAICFKAGRVLWLASPVACDSSSVIVAFSNGVLRWALRRTLFSRHLASTLDSTRSYR